MTNDNPTTSPRFPDGTPLYVSYDGSHFRIDGVELTHGAAVELLIREGGLDDAQAHAHLDMVRADNDGRRRPAVVYVPATGLYKIGETRASGHLATDILVDCGLTAVEATEVLRTAKAVAS